MEPLTFLSILFERSEDRSRAETAQAPAFFRDLNLDQIVDAVTASKEEYNLKPFFYAALHDIDVIRNRHEVMQDLENSVLFNYINSFAQKMRTMRAHLTQADKLSHKYQKQRWFLGAVEIYCSAVHSLAADVSLVDLKSRGLLAFRNYLTTYLESDGFVSLLAETQKLHGDLSTIKYCILIKGDGFKVRKYESESDYSSEVEETFAKFKQGAVKDYRVKFSEWAEMNHIEEKVLEYVALLYPDIFSNIDGYCVKNSGYLDKTVAVFDREIQFYIAYLEHAEMFKRSGLHYLASLGCPVPGSEARLFLFDQLFTHFEREEDIESLRGKLQDDIVRIHQILNEATPNSIIILNEIFTSITLQDEIFLSERVMEKIIELGLLCVWVTFVDELASFGKQTVSMVSTVFPEDPTLRTFKILRRAADGLSYAMSIAEKYRLTRDHLNNRLKI